MDVTRIVKPLPEETPPEVRSLYGQRLEAIRARLRDLEAEDDVETLNRITFQAFIKTV